MNSSEDIRGTAPAKTIVLTGASRGIGHATAMHFADRGWRVISCSRSTVPDVCPFSQSQQQHIEMDFSSPGGLDQGIAALLAFLDGDPIHALVNNAGISPKLDDGSKPDTLTTDRADWEEVFQVNVIAPALLTRALSDPLQRGAGAVVNVTSIAGERVHQFAGPAYAASKAALAALTRELAADFSKLGVRVNAIAPGEIKTTMLSPDSEEVMLPTIPLARLGTPEEVAQTIYFLCGDGASYITGAELQINGGQHV